MSTPVFIDEPLIVPVTPGEVWMRVTQVLGAMRVSENGAAESLHAARQQLEVALEGGSDESVAHALQEAQLQLKKLYESVQEDEATCSSLGFPSPQVRAESDVVAPIDTTKVVATFTLNNKQMLTSIAFERAANAKAYWLHEVRHFADDPSQRVEDAILESHAPLFDRVRLAPGTRTLRIKSRNLSVSALSDEFTIEVPAP